MLKISKLQPMNFALAPQYIDKNLLLQLVNNARIQGCYCDGQYFPPVAPIAWNNKIAEVATAHSRDMHLHNYFDHVANDLTASGDRLTRAGYRWSHCGENISKGYPTEQAVIAGWLSSLGHCRNIMSAAFTQMGVGTSGAYWTQVFADSV